MSGSPVLAQPLTKAVAHGVRWTTLGGVAALVVQVPYAAVMGRLLSPGDYGLLALASLMLRGVSYLTMGGGLPSAVVQRPKLAERVVRATFTLGTGAGLAAYLVVWLLAPYGTLLLHGPPELTAVSRGLALTLVIQGAGSTAAGLLRRSMRYRAVAAIEFGSHLFGYCGIGLVSAALGYGVLSLVYAALGQATISVLSTYALVRHPLRPLFDHKAMRETGSYGAQITLVGFLEMLHAEFVSATIGRYAGPAAAGHYNRAMLVSQLPFEQVSTAVSKVLLPAYSRIQQEDERLAAAHRSCTAASMLLFFPCAAMFAAMSDNLVTVLLGAQWHSTVDLVPPLAAAAAVGCVTHFPASLAEAIGDARKKIGIQVVELVILVAGSALAVAGGKGVHGIVTAMLVARLAECALYVRWAARRFPGSLPSTLLGCAQALAVAALSWCVIAAVGALLSDRVPQLAALVAQTTAAALLGVAVTRHGGRLLGMQSVHVRRLVPFAVPSRVREAP
ncbi:oligosaccharide flippase family protein [Streptomyces sp. NPDC004059]